MSEKNKPQIIIVGAGQTGKTAIIERIIRQAEEKGLKVIIFTPKDVPPSSPMAHHEFPTIHVISDKYPIFPSNPLSIDKLGFPKPPNGEFPWFSGKKVKRKKHKNGHKGKRRK